MTDIYKLWPARAPLCDPNTGLPTSEFVKALGRIATLLGGENNTLPVTFIYVPASGIANGIVYLNASGELTSTAAATNGQILIGRTGATPALGTIAGTVNRVTVTLGSGTITLSAPQDLHTGASPTFADLTLSGLTARSFLYSGAGGALDTTVAPTNGQLLIGSTGAIPVAATLTGTANQITVTNGAGSITLSLPQNIAVGSSPTFAGLTLSGLTANAFTYSGTSSALASTAAPTNGQLLIGSTGAAPVAAALTGTANQVTVTNGPGTVTLSLPQDLGTGSSPTFANITSGTYTPTVTNVANLDGTTAYECQYLRVGNVITVSGRVDVNPTLTATATQLGISLPVASNFGALEDCAGTAFAPAIASQGAGIFADTANDRAMFQYVAGDVTNQAFYFTFTYGII